MAKNPSFDAGRIRANIAVQDARTEQQLTTYEQTVLTALEEVENALVASSREQRRRVQLADAVTANQQEVALAADLYGVGVCRRLKLVYMYRIGFFIFPVPEVPVTQG